MSKKLLNELKSRLKTRRDHLLKEFEHRLKEFKDSGGHRLTDTADIASNIIEEQVVMSLAQVEAKEIEQIDNALIRLKSGKYGICERCGKKINKQRLRAIPFVDLCIKCKEAEERYGRLEDEHEDIYTNPHDN
jgi:RNA polymerase-binding protein DksA